MVGETKVEGKTMPAIDPRDRYTMEIKFSRNPRSGENTGEVKIHVIEPDMDLATYLAAQKMQAEVLLTMCGWGDDMLTALGLPILTPKK